MSELEAFWVDMCRRRKEDYVIVVDNDAAFVTELKSGDCVFVFNHYGWQLVLDLFLHLGCNAIGCRKSQVNILFMGIVLAIKRRKFGYASVYVLVL